MNSAIGDLNRTRIRSAIQQWINNSVVKGEYQIIFISGTAQGQDLLVDQVAGTVFFIALYTEMIRAVGKFSGIQPENPGSIGTPVAGSRSGRVPIAVRSVSFKMFAALINSDPREGYGIVGERLGPGTPVGSVMVRYIPYDGATGSRR